MSNHTYTRAGGVWNSGTGLTAAELADLDWKSTNSLSALGGVYSFDVDMVIGGADPLVEWIFELPVECNEQVTLYAGLVAYGDTTIGISVADTFTVVAESEFNGPANFNGSVDFDGIANFGNDVDFFDRVDFHGAVNIGDTSSDQVLVRSTAEFIAPVTFGDDVSFDGADIVTPVGFSGAGKIKYRSVTVTSSGDQSFLASELDTVFIPSGVVINGDDFTINDTGAQNGMRIRFATRDASNAVTVHGPGSVIVTLVGIGNAVEFERVAGAWQVVSPRDS